MQKDNTNPCYKCPERQPGCHSSCEKYIGWRRGYDKRKQKILENKKDGESARELLIRQTRKRTEKARKEGLTK